MVPDIQAAGQGSTGRNFKAVTDVNGIAVINVNLGDCKFTFKKDEYKTLNLKYKVTLSGSVVAYIQKAISEPSQNIDLTVHIHEGSMEGAALPGALINGRDYAGGKFNKAMGENGATVTWGTPCSLEFAFSKSRK
jgi:hypothetical protein